MTAKVSPLVPTLCGLTRERLRLEIKKKLKLKIKQLAEQLKTFRQSEPIPDDVMNQPKKNQD